MKSTLEIQNLKCGGCANSITTRLNQLNGIEHVVVNNEDFTVAFEHDNEQHLSEAIILLSKLGYPVSGENNPLSKKAKSYVSCAIGRMNS